MYTTGVCTLLTILSRKWKCHRNILECRTNELRLTMPSASALEFGDSSLHPLSALSTGKLSMPSPSLPSSKLHLQNVGESPDSQMTWPVCRRTHDLQAAAPPARNDHGPSSLLRPQQSECLHLSRTECFGPHVRFCPRVCNSRPSRQYASPSPAASVIHDHGARCAATPQNRATHACSHHSFAHHSFARQATGQQIVASDCHCTRRGRHAGYGHHAAFPMCAPALAPARDNLPALCPAPCPALCRALGRPLRAAAGLPLPVHC